MPTASEDIRATFVAAYPVYVARRLSERGVDVDAVVADAIVEGVAVLDALLADLETTEPVLQSASPLELFREALRPVGRVLDTQGVPPARRDPQQTAALPWDRHDLSPASARALGDEAEEAHLRWGVAKATRLGAPPGSTPVEPATVRLIATAVTGDTVRASLVGIGYRVVVGGDTAIHPVVTVVGDDVESMPAIVADRCAAGERVVVYGDAIDDVRVRGLMAAGVWKVVETDTIVHRPGTVLPVLA
ncbi:MAG: hypothetical protein KDB69_00565 [Acidimicrobiia bacterium]|nr:hypothetical protein [Acidimicrobiia bacterium]